jgi:hypothetical protein
MNNLVIVYGEKESPKMTVAQDLSSEFKLNLLDANVLYPELFADKSFNLAAIALSAKLFKLEISQILDAVSTKNGCVVVQDLYRTLHRNRLDWNLRARGVYPRWLYVKPPAITLMDRFRRNRNEDRGLIRSIIDTFNSRVFEAPRHPHNAFVVECSDFKCDLDERIEESHIRACLRVAEEPVVIGEPEPKTESGFKIRRTMNGKPHFAIVTVSNKFDQRAELAKISGVDPEEWAEAQSGLKHFLGTLGKDLKESYFVCGIQTSICDTAPGDVYCATIAAAMDLAGMDTSELVFKVSADNRLAIEGMN